MNDKQPTNDNSNLPGGFKVVLGTLLLCIAIGFMSLWGIFR